MKKYILLLIALMMISCQDDNSCSSGTGTVPENDIIDISKSAIPTEATGGDPRGTFFANEPLLRLISTDESKTVYDSTVTSSGRLQYIFTGKSADKGDFTLIEESFDIEVYLIWKNQYGQSDISFIQQLTHEPATKATGTWYTDDNLLVMEVCGNQSAVKFTSNSKGLFFINDLYSVKIGSYKSIMSYKRQN